MSDREWQREKAEWKTAFTQVAWVFAILAAAYAIGYWHGSINQRDAAPIRGK